MLKEALQEMLSPGGFLAPRACWRAPDSERLRPRGVPPRRGSQAASPPSSNAGCDTHHYYIIVPSALRRRLNSSRRRRRKERRRVHSQAPEELCRHSHKSPGFLESRLKGQYRQLQALAAGAACLPRHSHLSQFLLDKKYQ